MIKKYGYYDDSQYYAPDLDEAIEYAKEYVKGGIENTYVVVSATQLRDDFDFVNENSLQDENYLSSDVVYSIARIDGEIVENFIEK